MTSLTELVLLSNLNEAVLRPPLTYQNGLREGPCNRLAARPLRRFGLGVKKAKR